MPESMALWLPLMRGTFMKPAAQPSSAPPGNTSLGIDCQPPSVSARAPYPIRRPPSKTGRMVGCVLKRWNSSYGER